MKKSVLLLSLLALISCDGNIKKYYKNGNLRSIEKFANGKKNGQAIYYDSLGNLEFKVNFKNDLEDGLFEEYKDGELYTRATYKMGKADGESYDYKGGKLDIYSIFRNDSILFMRTYDSLGNIKAEVYYRNEIENGPFKFYKKGKLALSGFNVNGEMVGDKTYYDENGKVIKVVPVK